MARRGDLQGKVGRFLGLALLAACAASCALSRPPAEVQDAIRVVNRHLPGYVAEANRALAESKHPDQERLIGIGERLVRAVDALERWATLRAEGSGDPGGRREPNASGRRAPSTAASGPAPPADAGSSAPVPETSR